MVAAVVASAMLVGGGVFAAVSVPGSGASRPLVGASGAPAPAFSLPGLVAPERTRTLADFRGTGLVVNFWASWCGPCRTEMRTLESASEAAHGRVRFVGIDTNDTRDAATAFLGSVHVTYPTLSDPHGAVATAYGLFGLPTTVFVSPAGKIVGRHMGQLDSSTLQAALTEAFANRAVAPPRSKAPAGSGNAAGSASSPAGSGNPAGVPTSLADLMQLSPVANVPAPDFILADQRGQTRSLSSFRGRAVVLEFMDDHCTDICPIVSKEFVDAFKALGPAAARTVFVAVNVNPFHTSEADVAAFSAQQGLATIPSWRFFTGSAPALESVWHDYGVSVDAPNPASDVIHTSLVYFVDPAGRERFVAAPTAEHTAGGAAYVPLSQQAGWGRGIALVARYLTRG